MCIINNERIGDFLYEKQSDGTFIYKAIQNELKSQKKHQKSQYKEKPQYQLIEQYEKAAVDNYKTQLVDLTKQVTDFLINNFK